MTSASDNEVADKHLFFDLVPSHVLENVVRMMSASPKSEDWRSYLLAYEIIRLYDVAGDMGVFMRNLTAKICLVLDRSLTKVAIKHGSIEPRKGCLLAIVGLLIS